MPRDASRRAAGTSRRRSRGRHRSWQALAMVMQDGRGRRDNVREEGLFLTEPPSADRRVCVGAQQRQERMNRDLVVEGGWSARSSERGREGGWDCVRAAACGNQSARGCRQTSELQACSKHRGRGMVVVALDARSAREHLKFLEGLRVQATHRAL